MIKAVLFDLDGTLFDRDLCVETLVNAQYEAFSRRLTTIGSEEFVNRVVVLDEHGHRNKSDVYATLAREYELPAPMAAELAADFWKRYHSFCQPYFDVRDTLKELRRRGKKIGVITNGTRTVQQGTIDALGIRELLDVILVSEIEGVRKPDRAIFERAAAQLGVQASECCFVGDHPEVDIAGAKAANWWPVWKRSSHYLGASCGNGDNDRRTLGEILLYT